MYLIVFLSVPLVSVLICIKLIEKKAEKKHEAFLQVVREGAETAVPETAGLKALLHKGQKI